MSKIKKPREITVVFAFDWEDCDDVCAEIMLEDAIELKKKGVSYSIKKDTYPILPPQQHHS